MDKTIGNYTRQTEFPLDEETLLALQNNQAMLELLGNIAGDKTILSGCEMYNNNTMRNPGYVFIRTIDFPEGEILRYEGGSVSAGLYLKKTVIDVNANNVEYANAYTKRSVAAGLGDELFLWSDFSTFHTNTELKLLCDNLKNQINLLTPPPLGIVQIWAGTEAGIPEGYALCDGSPYNKEVYAALYAVIGDRYNNAKSHSGEAVLTDVGMFRLPDLRGRFIVGYSTVDVDYSTRGNAGGEKKHLLTSSESGLQAHSHGFNQGIRSNVKRGTTGSEALYSAFAGGAELSIQQNTAKNATVAHENRPPYYVLAYIIRLK